MDSVEIAVRDKRIAELTGIVTEQQQIILALQQQVEQLRRELHSTETGKPKGMPGNK